MTLGDIATERAQHLKRSGVLDALGDNPHSQSVSEVDRRAYELQVTLVFTIG